jgi:hypothetical protein
LTCRVPTQSVFLTSGNMLTPEIYKNCPPRVCDCNPAEVPQVWSLLLQFYSCQNSQAGYQFHALPRINYERPGISCAGFTKLVRLYPKLCSFQRNTVLERQPFHRVKESSITISWFGRYKFWNFCSSVEQVDKFWKVWQENDIHLLLNYQWNEKNQTISSSPSIKKRKLWRAGCSCCTMTFVLPSVKFLSESTGPKQHTSHPL